MVEELWACSSSGCEHNWSVFEQVIIIVHNMTYFIIIFFVECRRKLIYIHLLLIHNAYSLKKKEQVRAQKIA